MTKWVDIRYKCSCMETETTIVIPERGMAEDILDFTERMAQAISNDHASRSPTCRCTKMEYAKIPVENDIIGAAGGGTA